MRIIKAAKRADELVDTCYQCRSVIGVKEADIEGRDDSWSYLCPVCETRNYFNGQNKLSLFPWIMEEENEVPDSDSVREYTL
jgi:formate-dependent nitrite reductase cytochrome c552 subunit